MARAFDTPINTNDQSLDRVLAAGLPVLLVFLNGETPQELNQSLERLAREHAGDLLVVKIQARDNPASVHRFGFGRTPAVVGVNQGKTLSKAEGASASDVNAHALFLLGKGPKPAVASAPPTSGPQRASGDGASQRGAGAAAKTGIGPRVVSDATFDQEVMRSPQPVLVDFWAPWCGPCRMTEPIVERLAHELAGKVRFAKINVDENPGLTQRYGIHGIPTMMLVKDGKIVDRWSGALPEPAIRSKLAPLIG